MDRHSRPLTIATAQLQKAPVKLKMCRKAHDSVKFYFEASRLHIIFYQPANDAYLKWVGLPLFCGVSASVILGPDMRGTVTARLIDVPGLILLGCVQTATVQCAIPR